MRDKIKTMNDQELDTFILERLGFDGEVVDGVKTHLRFEMSGISDPKFEWIKENREIWDLFIDCGIYDRVCLFYMETYKGGVHLFYKWFDDDDYTYETGVTNVNVVDFTTAGTRGIIKNVLRLLCIDNQEKSVRRLN